MPCPPTRRPVHEAVSSGTGPDYRRCDRRKAFDEGGGRAQGSGSGFGGAGARNEREAERRRDPGPSLPWSARVGSDRVKKSEMVIRVAGEAQVRLERVGATN